MTEQHEIVPRRKLARSKNDIAVWYNPVDSHTATHFKDVPQLVSLTAEITRATELTEEFVIFHTDLGHVVGRSDLVTNEPGDKIVWAKRLNRAGYTIFNKTKRPQPSSLVTTAYERRDDGSYELVSAWIGPSDLPSMPGTDRETSDSKRFWTAHALAWGKQEIQPETETTQNPWQ